MNDGRSDHLQPIVDRDGGQFEAGIIKGVSVITKGEALGHDTFIDETLLQQVAKAINDTPKGIKTRFAHPSLSSDGMGKHVGRVANARNTGDKVLADMHILRTSRHTPQDGDLGGHVMDLADEDPEMFGISIVFKRDEAAENPEPDKVPLIQLMPDGRQLRIARLEELQAADVVDDPAANPDGLFARTNVPREFDLLFQYCLGVSEERPTELDVDPDRAKQFFNRFLNHHKLEVSKMATTEQPTVDKINEAIATRAKDYTERYGERGNDYLLQGMSIEQANVRLAHDTLAAKDDEIKTLQQAVLKRDEEIEVLQEEKKLQAEVMQSLKGDQGEDIPTEQSTGKNAKGDKSRHVYQVG